MSLFSLRHSERGITAAVEIASHAVSGVRLESQGDTLAVTASASVPLPEGAVVPGLASLNIRHRSTVADAVARVLEPLGRPRHIGLVVPDLVAKVSVVHLDHVPTKFSELDQVLRWQAGKTVPFAAEETRVSWVPGAAGGEGADFLVLVARNDVVTDYEAVCLDAGAQPGIVDLATLCVANAGLSSAARATGDWLLVHGTPGCASLAIVRNGQVALFRTQAAVGEGTLSDLVHQSTMYFQDRLGGDTFRTVMLSGTEAADAVRAIVPVDIARVDPIADGVVRQADAQRSAAETIVPALGLLLRARAS